MGPDTQVGVFWVLIRVLACAGLATLVYEGLTGELGKRLNNRVEVSEALDKSHVKEFDNTRFDTVDRPWCGFPSAFRTTSMPLDGIVSDLRDKVR